MLEFQVTGKYVHSGMNGTFCGRARVYDDSRFVGAMIDEGQDNIIPGTQKIVLGAIDNNTLQFMKLPSNPRLIPVCYVMKGQNNGRDFYGRYAFIQVPVEFWLQGNQEFPAMRELKEAFSSVDFKETFAVLERIDLGRIRAYLRPELISDIKRASALDKGELHLR